MTRHAFSATPTLGPDLPSPLAVGARATPIPSRPRRVRPLGLCLILSLSIPGWAHGTWADGTPTWTASYESGRGTVRFVKGTRDGGFVALGGTYISQSAGSFTWVFRVDSSGNPKWQRLLRPTYPVSLEEDGDGGWIIAGTCQQQAWVARLDSEGDLLWESAFSGGFTDTPVAAFPNDAGGYFLFMQNFSRDTPAWGDDIVVMGLDSAGRAISSKRYGIVDASIDETLYAVAKAPGGNFYLVGTADRDWAHTDSFVAKVDPSGNLLWQRRLYPGGSLKAAVATEDGGVVCAGAGSFCSMGAERDMLGIRLDPEGRVVWQKIYGSPESGEARAVSRTSDGGFLFAGTHGNSNDPDGWIVRTDPRGEMIWQESMGGTEWDVGHSVLEAPDSGVTLALESYSFGADVPAWLVKMDASGRMSPACDILRGADARAFEAGMVAEPMELPRSDVAMAPLALPPVAPPDAPLARRILARSPSPAACGAARRLRSPAPPDLPPPFAGPRPPLRPVRGICGSSGTSGTALLPLGGWR